MQKEDCLLVGTIVKIHGIHGEVVLDSSNPEIFENTGESVFLEIEGLLVPFFIDDWVSASNVRFRVKFCWIDTESAAKNLVDTHVYIPLKELEFDESDFVSKPHLLIGFKAIDSIHGELGKITDIIDNPSNPLIVITKEKKELLVPMHIDFIKEVKVPKKTITLTLPQGLVDLYE